MLSYEECLAFCKTRSRGRKRNRLKQGEGNDASRDALQGTRIGGNSTEEASTRDMNLESTSGGTSGAAENTSHGDAITSTKKASSHNSGNSSDLDERSNPIDLTRERSTSGGRSGAQENTIDVSNDIPTPENVRLERLAYNKSCDEMEVRVNKIIEDELPDDAVLQLVNDCLEKRIDPSTIIKNKFNIELKALSFGKLATRQWLDDQIMNFTMEMLKERSDKTSGFNKSWFCNTFFMDLLLHLTESRRHKREPRYDFESIARWKISKADIFESDAIYIPINIGNYHWALAVAFMESKGWQVYYVDPMGHEGKIYCEAIVRFIGDVAAANEKLFDSCIWYKNCTPTWTVVPQFDTRFDSNFETQKDTYNCGIFVLYYIFCFYDYGQLRKGLSNKAETDKFRMRIAKYILQGRIV